MEIYFNDSRTPVIVDNDPALANNNEKMQFYNIGAVEEVESIQSGACLSWEKDITKIFAGTVATQQELDFTVSSPTNGWVDPD